MKLIYIAGKYTDADPYQSERYVRAAEDLVREVLKLGPGVWPSCPHTNTRPYFAHLVSYEHALAGTLEMLRRSDAVLFHENWQQSSGARGEHAEALRLGLPVFYAVAELRAWLQERAA